MRHRAVLSEDDVLHFVGFVSETADQAGVRSRPGNGR
jgi:hypothetical protein